MTDEEAEGLTPEEQRIRATVREMSEVRADPAFREGLKRRFLSGEFAEPAASEARRSPHRWRPWAWVLVPTAAVILLIFFFPRTPSWVLHGVSGEGRIVIDGEVVTAGEPDRLARLVESATRVEVAEGVVLDLLIKDGLLFELDEGAQVALPALSMRSSGPPSIGEVLAGELRVKTGPGFSGHRLRIVTSESRTELLGTAVSVFKADDLTCVCVLEGTAKIGEDDARMEEVPSGMRKIMFADGRPSEVLPIEPHHEEGLLRFIEHHKNTFGP